MPIAALIEGNVFCAHAGIGTKFASSLNPLALIAGRKLPKRVEFLNPLLELLWADPAETLQVPLENPGKSEKPEKPNPSKRPRHKPVLFCRAVFEKFMKWSHVHLFVRGHQLLEEGFEYLWDHKLLTLFSAPNFCGMNNVAAIAEFKKYVSYPKIFARKAEQLAVAGALVEQENWTMVPEKDSSPPGREWMSVPSLRHERFAYESPLVPPANDTHTKPPREREFAERPLALSRSHQCSVRVSASVSASSVLCQSASVAVSEPEPFESCTSLADAASQFQSDALEPMSDREEQQQTPPTQSGESEVTTDAQPAQSPTPPLERSLSEEDDFQDLTPITEPLKSPV